jgi:hypothetical protein
MGRGKGWRVPVGRFAICQAAMLSEGWVRVLCLRHAARLLLPLQLGYVCCALGYVCCAHDGMLHACCCRYSWGTVCSEALSSRMLWCGPRAFHRSAAGACDISWGGNSTTAHLILPGQGVVFLRATCGAAVVVHGLVLSG